MGRVIYAILLISFWTPCWAQESQSENEELYLQVYEAIQIASLDDPFIQNGEYYTYPYYNANGHPFLGQKDFETGSVVFRGKTYEGLSLNYDIFNQQLILSREQNGVLQMNLLAPEFVSGFFLKGKQFSKLASNVEAPAFYQLISESGSVSCYYSLFKDRREIRDSGNRSIYSFSEQKSRRYLLLDEQLQRYKSNKTFLKLFPDQSRTQIKEYMKENRISVMEADNQLMIRLTEYCDKVLNQIDNQKGDKD